MKRTKLVIVLILGLVVGLTLSAALSVYAQGVGEGNRGDSQGVSGEGLDDPPAAGYSVLYIFSGVANMTSGTRRIATSVHCTNYGSSTVDTRVEMYSYGGGSVWWKQANIYPGYTLTFSSQPTNIFYEDRDLGAGTIDQGSGRVLASRSSLICTVHLVDPDSDQPSFLTELELYRR